MRSMLSRKVASVLMRAPLRRVAVQSFENEPVAGSFVHDMF
jgi:hypothetical protein